MPINDKRDPDSWYNRLPVTDAAGGNPRPKTLTASRLKANEIRWGDATLAKIPQIKGRISRKNVKSGYGDRVTKYVELILEKSYDKEKHQSRNRRVTIGIDISHIFDGMMIINKNYHKYFDHAGNLIYPLEHESIPEKHPNPDRQTPTEQQSPTEPEPAQQTDQDPEPEPTQTEKTEPLTEQAGIVMTNESNNQEPNQEDQESQAELNRKKHEEDHLDFLSSMLNQYRDTIMDQAKKRPDKKLTAYQIRKINKVLKELKAFFEDTDISDYLELAEEPSEDNPDAAMTYTDMEILLHAYTNTLSEYTMGRLWLK